MAALMRSVLGCPRLTIVRLPISVQVKRDVRALRRKPVRIIPPESEQRLEKRARDVKEPRTAKASAPDKHRRDPVTKDESRVQEGRAEEPHTYELKYDRAAAGDKRLSKVVTIVKSRHFRERHGQVLLEGQRLLVDALDAGAVLQTLFFSRVDQLKTLPAEKLKKANLIKVKFEDIKIWSDVVKSQGLMGIFGKPDHVKMKFPDIQVQNSLPLSLICDNIRDPGNLGTILRCAAGAGCNKVLLTKGCVDAWEPKVIRAGMGAHFRLPIICNLDWNTVSNYLSEDTRVFLADNFWQKISNETTSPSDKAIDYGWISSDPRRVHEIQDDYYSSSDEEDGVDNKEQEIPNIPIQRYYEPWARGSSALVIGGEVHGLSLESLLLAEELNGKRLYIPVVPGIESINSAMAASILLFEGRRQLKTSA
ncbi:rRNA methyltransferase 3, mitochondrial [Anomaloglossus baeobatrachus]|uniref:rRNA methyltransferase 3, mitochondrial n=1 Tax=Anomaloglossus baeobatrachus TaxID=238106 RepID=UPI003F4FBD29